MEKRGAETSSLSFYPEKDLIIGVGFPPRIFFNRGGMSLFSREVGR